MLKLFIPKEILPNETRVAATPETVKRMVKMGFSVSVEHDAGKGSSIDDQEFVDAGAEISNDLKASSKEADVILKLHPPQEHPDLGVHEAELYKEGVLLVSFIWPLNDTGLAKKLAELNITAFAMDQVPRISRAQDMDALSSQSNLAGYKAVLMAANELPSIFPLMMTAAGTIKPAKVVILGAGVAGLQAIATAKRLGAEVEVSDIRPAVKEQVESLGGKFIEVETEESLEDEGGYAKEVSKEFLAKQQEVVKQHMLKADVVITTALVPGRKAPVLIKEDVVEGMRSGSVIVDIATSQGGNCTLSEKDKTVIKHGVKIIGESNLPALVPVDASNMYAKNLLVVMRHLFPKGELVLDFEEEITKGSVVTHNKKIIHERTLALLKDSKTAKEGKK
mgnify:CR=1 FL=1